MVVKRQFGEDGLGGGNVGIPIHQDKPRFKFKKLVKNVMKEALLQDIATRLEPVFRRVVKQELELLFHLQPSPSRWSLVHPPESSGCRGYQLRFANKFPSSMFTNSRIESKENSSLNVELIDANSKNLIRHGPLSSAKIEILVLKGDFPGNGLENWSQREFNDNIVRQREGKRPLLVGDTSFTLINGVAQICNVSFTDNSSWERSRRFRLGVRVSPGVSSDPGVTEAVSESFVVLDHRGESYQKHDRPSLNDPVWRLKKIAKGGVCDKRLSAAGIGTVKQFLRVYNTSPSTLRTILGNRVSDKSWKAMVNHAEACRLDDTAYILTDPAEGVGILLNCVYKVMKVTFDGQSYLCVDSLNIDQMPPVEHLVQYVHKNLNKLVPVPSLSAMFPSVPLSIEDAIHLSVLQENDAMLTEEDKQLDFHQSEGSVSYPCTLDDGSPGWDGLTAQSSQVNQSSNPSTSTLVLGNSSAELSNRGHPWDADAAVNAMPTAFPQSPLFWEGNFPLPEIWGQGEGFFTSSSRDAHLGDFPCLHDSDVASPRSKAGWSKIRAVVMLKIVQRDAAARRKEGFSFFSPLRWWC